LVNVNFQAPYKSPKFNGDIGNSRTLKTNNKNELWFYQNELFLQLFPVKHSWHDFTPNYLKDYNWANHGDFIGNDLKTIIKTPKIVNICISRKLKVPFPKNDILVVLAIENHEFSKKKQKQKKDFLDMACNFYKFSK